MRFVAIYAPYLTAATGFHDSVEILVPLYIGIGTKNGTAHVSVWLSEVLWQAVAGPSTVIGPY